MKFDMSMSPSMKREFSVSPTPTVKSDVILTKKPTFFSIDQILGRNENDLSDDEVFEKDLNETDSFASDDNDQTKFDEEDVDMSEEIDENNNEEKKLDDKNDKDGKNDKQTPSYTAIIAQAILSSSDKKLPLGCIYEYIAEHFPEFLKKGQGWRNCVRHNLSLSECFIKAGRARNGRGNYWGIHPRYLKNFSKGDFRKRRASHRPRNRDLTLGYGLNRFYPHYYNPYLSSHNYGKTSYLASHRPGFSVDNILSKERSRETTSPPTLSSFKPWLREIKHTTTTLERGNIRIYSPPALSPVTPAYLEHYSYRSAYDYGRGAKTECSCQNHHKCSSPRTSNI